MAQEKSFALLGTGSQGWKGLVNAVSENSTYAEYPLGGAFDITNETQPEDGAPKLVITGHVAPRLGQGAYKITFSELGRPPAYSGQTSLTIRMQDRRVLMLPAIDLGLGGTLETVVLIQYKTRDQDDGETSRFEIN